MNISKTYKDIARDFLYKIINTLSLGFLFFKSSHLRVLAYHEIKDESIFEEQIRYLNENFNIISLHTLDKHLYENEAIPPNSILITFDDGDISILNKGLPILEKYNTPGCLFVITDLIDGNKDFWWNMVEIKESERGRSEKEINSIIRNLKTLSNKNRLKELNKYSLFNKSQLTRQDLKLLDDAGISIANHSHTHPMFNKCTEEEIYAELENSKEIFEQWVVGDFSVFAYPNGNWDKKTEKILKKSGIKMAFLFDHKINKEEINPFRISRLRVDSHSPLSEFKVKVSGLHTIILNQQIIPNPSHKTEITHK